MVDVPHSAPPPLVEDEALAQANRIAWQVLAGAALCLVVVGIVAHYIMASPVLLESSDALDNAVCARRIARGQGLTTQMIYPLTVGLGHDIGPQPFLNGGPFYPLFLSQYLGVRGEADFSVRLASALALIVTFGALIALGTRLFSLRIGIVAGLLVAVNPFVVETAASGAPHLWASAWFTLALACVVGRSVDTASPRRRALDWTCFVLGGLCMGLCFLTKLATLPLVLVLLWAIARQAEEPHRRRAMLLFAGAFLLVALPWWVRNLMVAQNPLFTLDRFRTFFDSPAFQGAGVLRSLEGPGNPYLYLLVHPRHALMIVLRSVAGAFTQIPMALGVVAFALFAAVLVKRSVYKNIDYLLRIVLWGALVIALYSLNIRFAPHAYLALVPAAVLLAAVHLFGLLATHPRVVRALAWVGIVALCIGPVAARRLTAEPQTVPTVPTLMKAVQDNTPEDIVLITDVPEWVAWYADRTALVLPLTPEGLDAILTRAEGRPLGYFFTPSILSGDRSDLIPYRRIVTAETLPEGLKEIPLEVPGGRLFVLEESQ